MRWLISGAAPLTSQLTSSSPSFARTPALTSSGSPAGSVIPWPRRAASIFSQMRGTAPHAVGLTDGRCATTVRGSATLVMVEPNAIDA